MVKYYFIYPQKWVFYYFLNTRAWLLVDNAGGKELSFNCFFAFIASSFVICSFLINLFVIFAFVLDLILLSIYDCAIGFATLSALSSSDGFNFLFSSLTIILYPSFLSIVYTSLLNFVFLYQIFLFSLIFELDLLN